MRVGVMEKEEIFAILLVGLVSLSLPLLSSGIGHFVTEGSYSHALKVEAVAKGEAVADAGLFHSFAAFVYSRAAALSGAGSFDAGLLTEVLKFLPGLLALIAGIAAYFALRGIFEREVSAAGALLLASSLPFASRFMANVVAPETLGFALFLCGAAFYAQALRKGDWRYALGTVLCGAAFLAWNGAVLAYGALALGAVAQVVYGEMKRERDDVVLRASVIAVILPLLFLPFASLSGLPGNFDAADAFGGNFLLLPLLLLTFLLAIVKAWGRLEVEEYDAIGFGIFAGSLLISGYSPLAALPGFAFAACIALRGLPVISKKKAVALVVLGAAVAFASFIFMLGIIGQLPALLCAILLGAAGGFLASMYGGKRMAEYAQISVAAVLLFTFLSTSALMAHYQSDPLNTEMDDALAWVRASTPAGAKIAAAGGADLFAFISQREAENDTAFVAGWLLGNASVSELRAMGIDYLVLDAGAFDGIEGLKNISGRTAVRIDAYFFTGLVPDEAGATYAAFQSQGGRGAYIPIDEATGAFKTEGDAILVDAGGNTRKVPVARFVLLKDSEGKVVRAIYPYENYNVNLFNAYFGSVNGLSKVYPEGEGEARVFRVGG